MRFTVIGLLSLAMAGVSPAAPALKDAVKPKLGVQTPGVQIPMVKLEAEAELTLDGSAGALVVEQSAWIANRAKNAVEHVDSKTNKLLDAVVDFNQPCMNPEFG